MGGHAKDRRLSRQADYDDAEENPTQRTGTIMSSLTYTDDLVPTFNAQDKTYTVTRWTQDVEDNSEIFQWTPIQTLIIARRALKGTAALWLKSERPFKTWQELKSGICKEFPDTVDSKTIHELMSARKKHKHENCLDYVLTMKELGKRGKLPDYVAIKYIIDGIEDEALNKMMLYGATTYPELKEKLKIYEAMKESMKKSERKASAQSEGRKSAQNGNVRRCYNCGEKSHLSSQCPSKGKGLKCFRCDEFGHISSNCLNNNKPRESRPVGNSTSARSSSSSAGASERENAFAANFASDVRKVDFDSCECDTDSCRRKMTVASTADSSDVIIDKNQNKENNLVEKTILLNNFYVKALIDSGSEVNLISHDVYEIIGAPKCDNTLSVFSGLGCTKVTAIGKLFTSVKIDGHEYGVLFYVIPRDSMPYSVVIGQDFLRNVTTILSHGSAKIVPRADEWLNKLNCFMCHQFVLGPVDEVRRKEVLECVEKYNPVQTKEAPIQLKIVLKDDIPVAQRPRRLSLSEREIVDNQVSEWLKDGIIRVSFSEYSSPVVLIKKKDGTTRVCIDYRPINRKMVKDEFPLPIIDDLIDRLKDAKVFSVLDLKNGFFHLKVSEESIKYTAFVTHSGQYEFLRAPFGLSVCPKYFMRFVSIIFRELIAKGTLIIFIDDILIPACDEVQAVERLKEVLEVASQYGLQINWKKASLLCHQIEYLGHIIENGQVRPSRDKTEAVTRYPEPKTIKQLHSFIGLTSYFRKYIKDFALIAKPLTDLLKKNLNFTFDDEQRNAFNKLKSALSSSPVLRIYDPKWHTELHTDASAVAYSAILLQRDSAGEMHPVHYYSRKTNDAEKKYTSYELEALAIIEGVKKFRHYLYGKHFKIVTDCQAFQMTLKKKDLTTRVARWVLLLEEYDYVIEHRPGSKMQHTDALSRNPYVGTIELHLHEQISRAQWSDEGCKAIIEILKDKAYDDYTLDNGLLYKGLDKRLVIPKCLEPEIMKRVHEKGHFGKKKMMEMLEKDYYIRHVSKKIDNFLLTCIPCLLATKKEGKQEGLLNSIEKEGVPLHTLHCDHIGPLSQTRKQYNYILTIVDGFTKFVWLFPVKGTTSRETIDKLLIHQQTFGNPTRMISDRGTAFTSNDFKDYCQRENIQHVMITTGVPRGNGQVERIHRIMIAVLTKLCISDPQEWYKHVGRVQQALNSTYQRSVDSTPFELMVGTKMKNKEDVEIYDLLQKEQRECFTQEREDLRKIAKQQILKIQEENRKTYNKRRKESQKYEEGDMVAIRRTQFGPCLKLKPKYLGPYQVVKTKRNDRYDVQKMDSTTEGPSKTSTSADYMKPWPDTADDVSIGE